MKPRRIIQVSVGILMVGLLAWVFHRVPFSEIVAILGKLRLEQLFLLGTVNLVILLLFSARWKLILQALRYPIPYLYLTAYRLAGFGISYFTPGPQIGGEPLQVYFLKARHSVPVSTAIASVTLDKLIELLTNFTCLALGLVLVLATGVLPGISAWQVVLAVMATLGFPLGYLILLWSGRKPVTAILHRLTKQLAEDSRVFRWSKIAAAAELHISEISQLRPGLILIGLGLSALTWLLMLWEYTLAIRFLGLSLPIQNSIGAFTAARVAFLLPSPGGLGTLEASQMLALGALGLPAAFGLSLSLLIRGRDMLIAGGGLFLGIILSRGHFSTRSTIIPESLAPGLPIVQEPFLVEVIE